MNSNLKNRHKATAVIICLLVHCMLIIGIVIMEFDDPEHGPIIMISDELQDAHQSISQEQWVAINSLPHAQFMHTAPQPEAPESQESPQQETVAPAQPEPLHTVQEEHKAHDELIEESVDELLELATQFMQERMPPAHAQMEPSKQTPTQPVPEQIVPTKQITLAQIAQGFMSQVQESPMAVQSDRQGQASINQLQQLHYCQKIIGCIVNSYKINRFNAPTTQQDNRLCIHLALKQDGTVHTLRLVESSGNVSLDQFVLAMFKDASSSFPPLPQSFKQVPFHLPFFNIDRIESLQTTQGWYIDNRQS